MSGPGLSEHSDSEQSTQRSASSLLQLTPALLRENGWKSGSWRDHAPSNLYFQPRSAGKSALKAIRYGALAFSCFLIFDRILPHTWTDVPRTYYAIDAFLLVSAYSFVFHLDKPSTRSAAHLPLDSLRADRARVLAQQVAMGMTGASLGLISQLDAKRPLGAAALAALFFAMIF